MGSRTSDRLDASQTDVPQTLQSFAVGLAAAFERVVTVIQPAVAAANDVCSRPEVQAGLRRVFDRAMEMHDRVEAIDAPGYTPYFEGLGQDGFEARLNAGLVRMFARRLFKERQDTRIALSALHKLAKRPRWHPALARHVADLRDHCRNASFLDEAFREAGCPELKHEMLGLLQGTCDGDLSGGPRLLEIIQRIAPHVPSPRGRPPELQTILHQMLLYWSADARGRQAYTYGPVPGRTEKDDFIDAATAATRIELGRPTFNPIAARRTERRRLAREAVTAKTR